MSDNKQGSSVTSDSAKRSRVTSYHPAMLGSKAPVATTPDEAARMLTAIGRRAVQRAPAAIAVCTRASCTQPEVQKPAGDLDSSGYYAWRLVGLSRDVMCEIDGSSARVLFGWTVGTTPLRALSTVERTIVTDVLRRLLTASESSGNYLQIVEALPRYAAHDQWVCRLRLHSQGPAVAILQLLATPDAPVVLGNAWRRSLATVALPLRAAISGIPCSLDTITSLRPGALLPLCRTPADAVMLYAGRRYVAAAQLGATRGSRALKVLNLVMGDRR